MFQQEVQKLTESATPVNNDKDVSKYKNLSIVIDNNNNSSDIEFKNSEKVPKKYVFIRPQNKDVLINQATQKINKLMEKENENDTH